MKKTKFFVPFLAATLMLGALAACNQQPAADSSSSGQAQDSSSSSQEVVDGYAVTFVTSHCKVLVYESGKDYTVTPKETNSTYAMLETGVIQKYDETDDNNPQPQVNFKVVADEGYSVNASNFEIVGEYKNLKQNPAKSETPAVDDESLFRITKVRSDLTVTITAVEGEQAPGHLVTFNATNCSIVVYIGPKNEAGDNIDTSDKIYTRSSDAPYGYSIDSKSQLNFGVVCNAGYEFVPEIVDDKVDFITGEYNKFQFKNGCYNMTKINSDLVINIVATAIAA